MSGKIIIISVSALLAGVVAVAVWKWPSARGKETTVHSVSIQQPGEALERQVDIITSGKPGEAHRKAIEIVDRIARQRDTLTDAETSRLLDYIAGAKPESLTEGDWQHLVNSVLNALRVNPVTSVKQRLSKLLAAMAREHKDPVIRLYALQHISFWYPHETDPARKQQMANLLKQLSSSGQEAGTAVMVMSDLQRQGQLEKGPQQDADIERAALYLVSDKTASTEVRVTALHTLTDRRTSSALPKARYIAEDREEHMVLRKAAIFAIGRLGNLANDTDRLKSLAKEHPRLAQAAKPALKKLKTSN